MNRRLNIRKGRLRRQRGFWESWIAKAKALRLGDEEFTDDLLETANIGDFQRSRCIGEDTRTARRNRRTARAWTFTHDSMRCFYTEEIDPQIEGLAD